MRDPARMYRESMVRGASPVGLVVILYEEAIRSILRAHRSVEQQNIGERTLAASHAIRVIGYLQSVLNFEHGGEVAKNLSRFYGVACATLLEANVRNDAEALASLAKDFSSLAVTWQQVERALASGAGADKQTGTSKLTANLAEAVNSASQQVLVSR